MVDQPISVVILRQHDLNSLKDRDYKQTQKSSRKY